MRVLYERLGTILSQIEPRNQRSRTWLDKLIFRCHENSKRELDRFATAASIQSLNHDWEIVLIIQGDDASQKSLYAQAENVLMEMEAAAEDGYEAAKHWDREAATINVVLADIAVPGLSGPELVREFRSIHPDVKAMIISGTDDPAALESIKLAGASVFLAKPFNHRDLRAMSQKLCGASNTFGYAMWRGGGRIVLKCGPLVHCFPKDPWETTLRKKGPYRDMPVFEPQILVVEDNSDDVLILEHALERAEILARVHVCRDGQEAIDYLKGVGRYGNREEFPFPRLMISDLKMPRCSGLDLLRWIQAHPRCSVVPVLILSTSAQAEDVVEAYRLGASTYLQKPLEIERLTQMLRDTVAFWNHAVLPVLPQRCE